MKKEMNCIACPLGCLITVEYEGTEVISVTGNTCKRGDAYARSEIVNPERSIHSTVKVINGAHPVVPCKTSAPIPKGSIFDVMKEINKVTVTAPVKIGQVFIKDVCGTGVDIVATNNDYGA
ncbi:MAG: DUF1667 domain-containing protein [Clostridiales bacterium]|nr:DUF1667 domain-containing protein [Clostridiales bacterium]MCD7828403.1 DUF1667 domain-containing protein [Clostridiales bacterium]